MTASGSKAVLPALERDFRFPAECGLKSDIAGGPVRSITGLTQCSKQLRYSITSSARLSNVAGIVTPNVLAVLRLIIVVNLSA